ncbi:unnamed protein product [Boreogadus saida]
MGQIPGFSSGSAVVIIVCCLRLTLALQCLDNVKPCINNATCLTFPDGTGHCSPECCGAAAHQGERDGYKQCCCYIKSSQWTEGLF